MTFIRCSVLLVFLATSAVFGQATQPFVGAKVIRTGDPVPTTSSETAAGTVRYLGVPQSNKAGASVFWLEGSDDEGGAARERLVAGSAFSGSLGTIVRSWRSGDNSEDYQFTRLGRFPAINSGGSVAFRVEYRRSSDSVSVTRSGVFFFDISSQSVQPIALTEGQDLKDNAYFLGTSTNPSRDDRVVLLASNANVCVFERDSNTASGGSSGVYQLAIPTIMVASLGSTGWEASEWIKVGQAISGISLPWDGLGGLAYQVQRYDSVSVTSNGIVSALVTFEFQSQSFCLSSFELHSLRAVVQRLPNGTNSIALYDAKPLCETEDEYVLGRYAQKLSTASSGGYVVQYSIRGQPGILIAASDAGPGSFGNWRKVFGRVATLYLPASGSCSINSSEDYVRCCVETSPCAAPRLLNHTLVHREDHSETVLGNHDADNDIVSVADGINYGRGNVWINDRLVSYEGKTTTDGFSVGSCDRLSDQMIAGDREFLWIARGFSPSESFREALYSTVADANVPSSRLVCSRQMLLPQVAADAYIENIHVAYWDSIKPTFGQSSSSVDVPSNVQSGHGVITDCGSLLLLDYISPSDEVRPNGSAIVVARLSNGGPADWNGDGVVDVLDLFAFLSDWFAGNSRADLNGNDVVDVADIFRFLQLFFASPSCLTNPAGVGD